MHEKSLKVKWTQVNPQVWRETQLWNEENDCIIKAFKPLIEHVYNNYGGKLKKPGEKFFIAVSEFENLILDAGLVNDFLFQRDVAVCFNLSMMTHVDEIE